MPFIPQELVNSILADVDDVEALLALADPCCGNRVNAFSSNSPPHPHPLLLGNDALRFTCFQFWYCLQSAGESLHITACITCLKLRLRPPFIDTDGLQHLGFYEVLVMIHPRGKNESL
jgi:hypothetical protein